MSYQGFIGRLSEEEQDFSHIKSAAAEFYRVNRVPQEIERALNELFFHKPEDVHGYLVGVCFPAVDPTDGQLHVLMLMLATFLQYRQQLTG